MKINTSPKGCKSTGPTVESRFLRSVCLAAVGAVVISSTAHAAALGEVFPVEVNFNSQVTPTAVSFTSQYATGGSAHTTDGLPDGFGVNISATGGIGEAWVYNTDPAVPQGDPDLESNVGGGLIVQEPGNGTTPDDAVGGTLRLDFESPVESFDMLLLDIDEADVEIFVEGTTATGATGSFGLRLSELFPPAAFGDGATGQTRTITAAEGGLASISAITYNMTDTAFGDMDAKEASSGSFAAISYLPVSSSLGDLVFEDLNGNGQQDAGEPGVDGVTVRLLDENGVELETTDTAGGGFYSFTDLFPGDYIVDFVAPAGTVLTTANSGNDATDSDADPATGESPIVTLAPGENNVTIDAGIVEVASLGDVVFEDLNGNGQQDAGEPGVNGVTVNLIQGGAQIATTTTDDGAYSFGGLAPGDYIVEFVAPAGTTFTTANTGNDASDSDADETTGQSPVVTLASGENDPTIDAGIVTLASLGNFVFNDENRNGQQDAGEAGVNGVTVNLLDENGIQIATDTTAGGGLYLFEDLAPGDYIVEFTNIPNGFELTTPNQGADATDSDAALANGRTGIITLASGDEDLTNDAGIFQDASLGDIVFEDTNGNGIQDGGEPGVNGVTVNLLDENGVQIATTETVNGAYSFSGLPPGNYIVEFIAPPNSMFTSVDSGEDDAADSDADPTTGRTGIIMLASGENNISVDAGIMEPVSLGDVVFEDINGNGIQDGGEPGVNGVTINLLDENGIQIATTETVNGAYSFSGLAPGSYIVEFVAPIGSTFTTANSGNDDASDSDADPTTGQSAVVTLASGENNPTIDAGIVTLASLGNFVFNDENRNGQQDAGEAGVDGVTVNLLQGGSQIATATTAGRRSLPLRRPRPRRLHRRVHQYPDRFPAHRTKPG